VPVKSERPSKKEPAALGADSIRAPHGFGAPDPIAEPAD
jgi:hypothetical protein